MNNQAIKTKSKKSNIEKEYITIPELSEMLSIPERTLRGWRYRREMPFQPYKVNRHVLFKKQEVKEWMETKGKELVANEFNISLKNLVREVR